MGIVNIETESAMATSSSETADTSSTHDVSSSDVEGKLMRLERPKTAHGFRTSPEAFEKEEEKVEVRKAAVEEAEDNLPDRDDVTSPQERPQSGEVDNVSKASTTAGDVTKASTAAGDVTKASSRSSA